MGYEEDTSPKVPEVEDSTPESKIIEEKELEIAERCDSVPETVAKVEDTQLVVSEPPIVAEDGRLVVAQDETLKPDGKSLPEPAIAVEEELILELHDSRIASAEAPIAVKDHQAVVVEEVTAAADTKMEQEAKGAFDGSEKSVPEFQISPLAVAESPISVKYEEAVTVAEGTNIEAEAAIAGRKSAPSLYNLQLTGSELHTMDKNGAVVADSSKMEWEAETVAEAAAIVENSITELNVLEMVSIKSPTSSKGDEEVVMEKPFSTNIKTETETETGLVPINGENPALRFGNLQLADPHMVVKDNEQDGHLMEDGILTGDIDKEMEQRVETAEGIVEEHVSELHDLHLVDAEPMITGKHDRDVNQAVAGGVPENQMEMDVITKKEVEAAQVTGLQNVELVGTESPHASKDDEVDAAGQVEVMMADTNVEMETEIEAEAGDGDSVPNWDESHFVAEDEEDERIVPEEENLTADTEMETETDVAESGKTAGGKRKRGRNSKVPANSRVPTRGPSRKTTEEDVCFICFDGGDLVLCDRRGCPKAYHPSCVNRDEAFFRAKGRWNCGWHLCSICEKNAHYMCYTCTFSLCKWCIKDAVILCIRGNKGFCQTCMKTVLLIENNEGGKEEDQVDFDDRSSWEFLFKDYYMDLKAKLSLSSTELAQAKNPWKVSDILAGKEELPDEQFDANDDGGSASDNSADNLEASKSKRRKSKKRSKTHAKEVGLTSSPVAVAVDDALMPGNTEWASKELLEFVMHMKNGDRSVLSQFDVQALLLEYIKRNKLRDPRRKSQIICDSRLENLFGKARVGHFEMLKLLESHFLIKDDSQTDDFQGSVVDNEVSQLEVDGNTDTLMRGDKDRKRKKRKRSDGRGRQSNLDDYAAIDMHNIKLIYLRRKLMEDLLEDTEKFHEKVVGTFVRIRISGSLQKQDLYRLVQVAGTSKAVEPYKIGKRTTDVMLEILNLNKTEVISIDTISNQDFTEDECKRLRQSIKCGLINRLTVGEILDKAMEVQAARVNDWLEAETMRLSHLRDRASETGRRKELRECIEKLQLLKTPEERWRRLEEIPEIHADPNMDPSYESEDDDSEMDDNRREGYTRPRGSVFSRRGRDPISPVGDFSSKDSLSGTGINSSKNWELNRSLSNKFSYKGEDTTPIGEMNSWNQGRDRDMEQSNSLEKLSSATDSETSGWNNHSAVRSETFSVSETSPAAVSTEIAETAAKINESEKMWHYQDPSGKVQGPFSIVQLRKWSNNGYFPVGLKVWKTTEKQDDSILLIDALAGRFQKADTLLSSFQAKEDKNLERVNFDQKHETLGSNDNIGLGGRAQSDLKLSRGWTTPLVEVPKSSTEQWSENDSLNLPSPTPKQSTEGWAGGEVGPPNGVLQSHAAATQDSGMQSSTPTSVFNSGVQFISGSDNDLLGSCTSLSPATTSEQGIVAGSTSSLQTSQSAVIGELRGLHAHSQMPPAPEMASHIVQLANNLNPNLDTLGWGTASFQKVEPNSSAPMSGQPPTYGHWGDVTSTVQNTAVNFSTPGTSAIPQPDFWRPPVVGNQSNMQPSVAPNFPWGIGIAQNNSSVPVSRPENPNMNWGPIQGNPNIGWGGPMPGNMNWGATVQGSSSGNLGWVVPAGNPAPTVQGPVPGNVNPWVAPTGTLGVVAQGMAHGNTTTGWAAAPPVNMGATVQGLMPGNVNLNWASPSANSATSVQGPAPGNASLGWGTPAAGSQGTWRNEQQNNGDRSIGHRERGSYGDSGYDGGKPWNRQSSFGSGGPSGSPRPFLPKSQRVCPYYQSGHCKKGAACDYMHPQ